MRHKYLNRISQISLLVLTCFIMSACATASQKENMAVMPSQNEAVPPNHKLYKAISIGSVTGGEETSPLWKSKVDNQNFKEALKASLRTYQFLSEKDNSQYVLNTNILDIDQPFFGIDYTVTSTVHYILEDKKTNALLSKTIQKSGIAGMDDAFLGVERLRIANERSIQNNLKALMEELKYTK